MVWELYYDDGNVCILLDKFKTYHRVSIDEALELCEIDMDNFAEEQSWDDWDEDALRLVMMFGWY
jgi:hypothetical protein